MLALCPEELEELNRKLVQMSSKRDALEAEWIIAAEALN